MVALPELRDRHAGATVIVIGSGGQLDDLDPDQFKDEVTVAINDVPFVWGIKPTYALTKYHSTARRLLNEGHTVVVSRFHQGVYAYDSFKDDEGCYVFDHLDMVPGLGPEGPGVRDSHPEREFPVDPDWLVVGATTTITALHFACYLGAARIVELGIGGTGHLRGYYPPAEQAVQQSWLGAIREPLQRVRRELRRRYGVRFGPATMTHS